MLNSDNGDQNCLVLMKVQGLRAGCVNLCMHSAKYKERRTSKEKQQPLRGTNVKGFESLRLQKFE